MGRTIRIGSRLIGEGQPCFVIAEIGINHNGDLALAKQLIDASKEAGADAVKFQKRTVDVVYSPEELARSRESPFGTTNEDLKRGLEFGRAEYTELDQYCTDRGMLWCTSCWDEESVDFIEQFNPPCYKIASACLTDDGLLREHHKTGRPIILSTGMSTMEQIRHAVRVLDTDELVILHCTSTYPSKPEELNLRAIRTLAKEFPNHPIGYSGHEVGLRPLSPPSPWVPVSSSAISPWIALCGERSIRLGGAARLPADGPGYSSRRGRNGRRNQTGV